MTREKIGWFDSRGGWVSSFPRANILAIEGFDQYCEIEVAQVPPVGWGDNKLRGIVQSQAIVCSNPNGEKISLELIDEGEITSRSKRKETMLRLTRMDD